MTRTTRPSIRRLSSIPWGTPMGRTSHVMHAAVVAAALMLSACDKSVPEPPTPLTMTEPTTTPPMTAGGSDVSVPDAALVVTPAGTHNDDQTGRRSEERLTDAQESKAMPMPGQNNDHSLPPTSGKPASAP